MLQKKSNFLLLVLMAASYAGNYFSLSLLFGVDFLFGSIAVLLVVSLFGVGWGTLTAFLAGSYTYFLWNHPYAAIILICEAIFVGFFLYRKSQNILILDGIYWLLIGMPLVWLFYGIVMQVDTTQTLLIVLKQSVNGIFNALVASLIIHNLPIQKCLERPLSKKTISFQQALFNLFVAFVFFSVLTIMILDGYYVLSDIQNRLQTELRATTTELVNYLDFWYERRILTLRELSQIAAKSDSNLSNQLQQSTRLIQRISPAFSNLYVADATGTIVASYSTEELPLKIGSTITDKPNFKETRATLKSTISDLYNNSASIPHIGLSIPVIKNQKFGGLVYADFDLSEISDRLKSHVHLQGIKITLLDRKNRIIASTQSERSPMQYFDRNRGGDIHPKDNGIYQWLPPKGNLPPMVRWKQSFYVQETPVNNLPWTLVAEIPAAPYVRYLQTIYIKDLIILLLISGLSFILAIFISRRVVSPLSELAQETKNLPHKLLDEIPIAWLKSPVAEIDSLVQNFKLMALALQQKFQEIQSINDTLEQRVQRRTVKLSQVNKKLKKLIKERRQAELALRENEERLARIFETIPDGIIILDSQGQIISANVAAEQILGLTRDSITQRIYNDSAWRIATVDGKPFPDESLPFAQVMRTGKPVYGIEHAIEHPDGTRKILSINAAPLYNSAGEIASAIAAVIDITERTQAEEALRQERNFVDAILDTTGALVIVLDPQGRIVRFNRACEKTTHYSFAEVQDKYFWDFFLVPEEIEAVKAAFYELQQAESFYQYEHYENYWIAKDGSRRLIAWSNSVLLNADGSPQYIIGSGIDITQRQQAEVEIRKLNEELEQRVVERTAQLEAANKLKDELLISEQMARTHAEKSEQRFRFLAEVIPVQVWTAQPNGELDYVNPRVLDYFGCTSEEILGAGWQQALHPDDLLECLERWRQSLETGSLYEMEFRLRGADGSYRWHLARALPLRDSQPDGIAAREGKILSWFGTNTDIDDRKRAEEVLRQQAEALAQANRMKDEFLAVVSHELRTPLNSILGWSTLLRARQFDEATTARALETIERNAQVQAQLIDDILDISRIIRGKLRLMMRPVNLVLVIEAAIDAVIPTAAAKTIELESTLDAVGLVLADADRLQQVIWNLLSNAIKFTPASGRVEVKLKRIPDEERTDCTYAQIQVIDTGKGISTEFLPYVFDRFRQADSSITRSYGGLGLGLAIVRHLVELHGGTVSAESLGEGQGATFTVKLPLLSKAEERVFTLENQLSGSTQYRLGESAAYGTSMLDGRLALTMNESNALSTLSGLHILVVDDDADTREFLITILEESGAQVIGAASVEQAIAALKYLKPDVLVSDIGMPDEDGYALIRQVRATESEDEERIPAIALTAYARGEDRRQALDAGFEMHIPKPVDPATLLAAIAQLAGRMI